LFDILNIYFCILLLLLWYKFNIMVDKPVSVYFPFLISVGRI